MTNTSEKSYLERWVMAARPRTLPAAVSPVLVGWALAWRMQSFQWDLALVLLGVALVLQINANLINDVVDYQKGLDTAERLGPVRVTQAGLLSPRQVWGGVAVMFGLAGLLGLTLAWRVGWPVIGMGLAAFAGALAYSTGPFPLAKHGFGEVGVMAFFGFLAVCGSVFVLTGSVPALAWGCGLAVGAWITNILVVNNLRDIHTDRAAGRHNIPVIWGYRAGEAEYIGMAVLAALCPLLFWILGWTSAWVLLTLLALWPALRLVQAVHARPEGRAFNPLLADTARQALIFSILLAIGLVLG